MNKRDIVLNIVESKVSSEYVPAAFFMHFDPEFHKGQPAINKHLEFFRYTGMDFLKIQYEQIQPTFLIEKPQDWAQVPLYPEEFHEPTWRVVEGLVKEVKKEALVIMTLYSPFMWAMYLANDALLDSHLKENPEATKKGLEIMAENVIRLARGCKRAGVDGFYASTVGGEIHRFKGTNIFEQYVKPTDLAVWNEIRDCTFNILHVCDFDGEYDDLTPYLDYPGHMVNCSLAVGDRKYTASDISHMFGRPYLGGLDRKGAIAKGGGDSISLAVRDVVQSAPDQFILGADCTMLPGTPWEHIKTAIDIAHHYK